MQDGQDFSALMCPQLPACEMRVLDGRYRLRWVIGRGHLADVYLGDDLRLVRTVAIKIPHQHVIDDRLQLDRFRREAVSLAAIRSPAIAGVYDLSQGEQREYLVMQHIEGPTIGEEIRRFGPIAAERAADVLMQMLGGLAAMHEQGLVHGDLRPSNVLLARDDKLILLNLGIVLDTRRSPMFAIGTGEFSEGFHDIENRTFACDVYQVGLLLLFMLTGVDPARRSQRHGFEDLFECLPMRFVALVRRALDTDPVTRFASAVRMQEAAQLVFQPATSHAFAPTVVRQRATTKMSADQLLGLLPDTLRDAGLPKARADVGRVLLLDSDNLFVQAAFRALAPTYRVAVAHGIGEALAQIEAGARFDAIFCGVENPATFHDALVEIAPDQAAVAIFLTGPTMHDERFFARVTNKRLTKPEDASILPLLI